MSQEQKRGSVLPTVLVAVLLIEVLLLGSLHVYRTRFYAYSLLINHYQSQTVLSLGEFRLVSEHVQDDKRSQGVMRFDIGNVSFTTADYQTYSLKSQLLNGYQEERSVTLKSDAAFQESASNEAEPSN